MKYTALLTAFVFAAFLYDRDYVYVPLFLVVVACWEGFVSDWVKALGHKWDVFFSRHSAKRKLAEMEGQEDSPLHIIDRWFWWVPLALFVGLAFLVVKILGIK